MGSGNSRRIIEELKAEIRRLRGRLQEIHQKDLQLARVKDELKVMKRSQGYNALVQLEEEISQLRSTIRELQEDLEKARSEADMYRSVNDLAMNTGARTSLASLVSRPSLAHLRQNERRQARMLGISAEPGKNDSEIVNRTLEKFPKDQWIKDLISEAIQENNFLKHLQLDQIDEIIDCMKPMTVQPGSSIIKEGKDGDQLYVIESGEATVTKHEKGKDKFLRTMREKTLFGELAILYSTPRTASVTAVTRCNLWYIERGTFQIIMMKTGLLQSKARMEMVRRVPRFRNYSEDLLSQIIDAFDENIYDLDEYIVRQGAWGDTFYIITSGKVLARKVHRNGREKQRYLEKGDYFGENVLDREEVRHESIVVTSLEGVTCLCIDRGTLRAILERDAKNASVRAARKRSSHWTLMPDDLKQARLRDLYIIQALGVGAFGRVNLIHVGNNRSDTYALKQIKKCHVVATRQQDHILNERRILMECKSDFIIRLYRTYRNNKFVFLLMEACLGGELWIHLQDRGPFDNMTTKFYTACTMEALDYLHIRGIVYRDLKPENLIMSATGYIKLVDFGFAKKIGHGKKTWTFCGTPEYVAPEIILNKGHDLSADLWSLGILMFEFLTGRPPFSGSDQMKTYDIILRGIDAIYFPKKINKTAQNLIKMLCQKNPVDRIGYGRGGIKDVQRHKWFDGFSWDDLRSKVMHPPILPSVKSSTDTSNIYECPDDNDEDPPDDLTGWDKEF